MMFPTERMLAGVMLVAIVATVASTAFAQESLPTQMQDLMRSLPAPERARLLQRQQRLQALSPTQQQALRAAMVQWDALPAPARARQREAWQAWQAFSPHERQQAQAARVAYEALPDVERQALRARFDALDEGLRRGWLLGPALGADWPRLHALVAQVPAEQQDVLVEVLRGLSPQARADLAVLAQRTPPEERDALRRELISTDAAARAPWLRRRVDP